MASPASRRLTRCLLFLLVAASVVLHVGRAPSAASAAVSIAQQGWGYVDSSTAASSVGAWQWSGAEWSAKPRPNGQRVYVWPYDNTWSWSWDETNGWLMVLARDLSMGSAVGVVKPNASNTGVPAGTRLTRHDGDLVITKAGTVIDALDIYGVVQVKAANVTIRRSRVHGRGAGQEPATLLTNLTAGATNFLMEDSELTADFPSVKINDFMGGDMTLRRIESTRGVDTGGVFRSNVTIEQSWLHDSTHYDVDPGHADNQSHNDGIQVHGGSNYRFVGNTITGHNNAAIMVNQAVSHTSGLLIDRNWLDGGGCSINIAGANQYGTSELTVTGNRFGRNQKFANCAIIVSPTKHALTQSGNVWEATGAPVTLSRGS